MKLTSGDRKLLKAFAVVALTLAGISCCLLAFGYMMGDPKPGIKLDRSPAIWLSMLALGLWGIAGWLLHEKAGNK